jgi:DNA polymerase-1
VSKPSRPVGGPGSVFLVDASNFIYRAFHALPPLSAPDGTPVNAVHGFVRMLQALRKEYAPEALVAVFDSGRSRKRTTLFPAYKAQRPPTPEDLVPQFELARKACAALGIPHVEVPEIEADDIIASYAVAGQRAGRAVTIASSDKDLMQLVGHGADGEAAPPIQVLDTMKQRLVDPAAVEEKFGVRPELLGDLLALTGDSSDNIPGVPGIGPKTAAGLLHEFGSLAGVLANAASIKQEKRRESLIAHADAARLSRALVELDTAVTLPLPLAELGDQGADPEVMAAFFGPLGFRSLVGAAAVRAGAVAQGGPAGASSGAFSLQAGAPLKLDPGSYSILKAGEEARLESVVAALARAEAVAVQIAVDVADAMLARLIGVALAGVGDAAPAPIYVPLAHDGDGIFGSQIGVDEARRILGPLLAAASLPKIVHAHKFQSIVLGRAGLELAGVTMDPQLCSYTLDPARSSHTLGDLTSELLGYALPSAESVLGKGKKALSFEALPVSKAGPVVCERAAATAALGVHLRGELARAGEGATRLYETIEAPLAAVLRRMEERGVLVDPAIFAAQSAKLAVAIEGLRASIEEHAGHPVNPDSPTQLQKLLFEELGLEAGRKTKTGYSTDAAVLEELSLYHPIVNLILEYRTLTKLKGTYLDTLPLLVNPRTGRLHTSFRQAVAQTGRLSSKDPNLQNIPIRSDLGRQIREGFVAPPGRVLVTLDYSQIELRILAHLSGDTNLCSAFRDGVDVHRRTAAEVFEIEEAAVTSEQRRVAKAVNFGVIYGQTAFGLARQLGIPRGKAGSYIKAYLAKLPGVTQYMDELVELAKRQGYAETILGRRRRIPELDRRGAARSYGERIARNTPIQGSAADVLKRAMIDVEVALASVDYARMLLTVHDELIFECDEGKVDLLVATVKPLMEQAVALKVPLVVEGGHGKSWAACKG